MVRDDLSPELLLDGSAVSGLRFPVVGEALAVELLGPASLLLILNCWNGRVMRRVEQPPRLAVVVVPRCYAAVEFSGESGGD